MSDTARGDEPICDSIELEFITGSCTICDEGEIRVFVSQDCNGIDTSASTTIEMANDTNNDFVGSDSSARGVIGLQFSMVIAILTTQCFLFVK